jgi:hypothetical protein
VEPEFNAIHIIVPVIEDVRNLRHTFVSHMSEAGFTLDTVKLKIPIDDIDGWLRDATELHQKAVTGQQFLSQAALQDALSLPPMELMTKHPFVMQLTMQMTLGQKYKDALSEWIADLPGALAEAQALSAAESQKKASAGPLVMQLLIAGGLVLAGSHIWKGSGATEVTSDAPGIGLVIAGGIFGIKVVFELLAYFANKFDP